MELAVGAILDGTVKSITAFGAFVTLPEGKTGLVHISEVANTYVSDIHQFLTVGQQVRVRVISAETGGRISLSIKQAQERPQRKERPSRPAAERPQRTEPQTFEEKLKQFMADSDNKIAGVRQYERKTRSRRR
ncbi:MAG: S1 RNA-binding domain-containing protein [Candidatus Faecousia sp.]|nr:S1 RNA-binding domain-containing protein [Candidatus Faecousia sp.]